jgi:hypothetical protein
LVRFFRRTLVEMVESGGHAFLTQGRRCRSIQSSHYGTCNIHQQDSTGCAPNFSFATHHCHDCVSTLY